MLERRYQPGPVEARESDGAALRLVGHAAVFDTWSPVYWGFRERVAPGAFDATLKSADVLALFDHQSAYILGRTSNKTFRTHTDGVGLVFDNDPPQTQTIKDLVIEPVKRGDIKGMSFGFNIRKDEWARGSDGIDERTILQVDLTEESIVSIPWYPTTDIGVRDMLASRAGVNVEELGSVMAKRYQRRELSTADRDIVQRTIAALQSAIHEPGPDSAARLIADLDRQLRLLSLQGGNL